MTAPAVKKPTPIPSGLIPADLPLGLVTHDDLDRHEREAAELHARAAELRDRLSTDSPSPDAAPEPRRRVFGLPVAVPVAGALVAVAVVALIAAGTRLPWTSGGATSATDADRPATSQQAVPGASVPEGLGLPTAGPGIDAEGMALGIRFVDERPRVAQRIVLGQGGLRDVALVAGSTPGLDGDVGQLKPKITRLRAVVNGGPATVVRGGSSWTVAADDGARVQTLLLVYDLDDAIARSTPSTSGRALALVEPLMISGAPAGTLQARTASAQVLGMVCPAAPEEQMLCGRFAGGAWQATVPADVAAQTLLLQLDLNARP